MTGWLLDTNVLSELRRPRPDNKVLQFVAGQTLDLSLCQRRDLRRNPVWDRAPQRRDPQNGAQRLVMNKLRPMFEDRVLAITEDIMLKWRLLVEDGRKAGYTFAQPDLLIAATALHHGLTVVSRNTVHFEKANVPVLDPWTTVP